MCDVKTRAQSQPGHNRGKERAMEEVNMSMCPFLVLSDVAQNPEVSTLR